MPSVRDLHVFFSRAAQGSHQLLVVLAFGVSIGVPAIIVIGLLMTAIIMLYNFGQALEYFYRWLPPLWSETDPVTTSPGQDGIVSDAASETALADPAPRWLVICDAPAGGLAALDDQSSSRSTLAEPDDRRDRQWPLESCAHALESLVHRLGAQMIDRSSLDRLTTEIQFQINSGLVDETTAVRVAKMVAATHILVGTLDTFTQNSRTFSGYNINTEKVEATLKLSVRAIEIETGRIEYTERFQGGSSDLLFAPDRVDHAAMFDASLEEAVRSLANDAQFAEMIRASRQAE